MLHEQQQTTSMLSDVRERTLRSAREYTMFARAQLMHNWHEQRPSNKGDFDSSVKGT
jgi:hypothetical protein